MDLSDLSDDKLTMKVLEIRTTDLSDLTDDKLTMKMLKLKLRICLI